MAPEVMCRQNHCCAVDYFAIGVIGFEFMLGKVSGHTEKRMCCILATVQWKIAKGDPR
jgi:hypothetical protein